MSNADKARNEAEQYKGKAKEWIGDKTDNESLEAEGIRDQSEAGMKQAGEHVKDAGRDIRDSVTGR